MCSPPRQGLLRDAGAVRPYFPQRDAAGDGRFPGGVRVWPFSRAPLLIETIFSLDGLGLLSFESVLNRDYPVVFANLYIFALVGLVVGSDLRPHLHLDRSRIDFETREVLRWTSARGRGNRRLPRALRPRSCGRMSSQPGQWGLPRGRQASNFRRSTPGAGAISRPISVATVACGFFLSCSSSRCSPS